MGRELDIIMSVVISVIVPIYNASKYLTQCIESILQQTYKELEIILINDGSTDQSGQICEKYEKIDSRIHFISQQNGGSVKARKTGLKAASGKYIGFVDADDYIEPEMFEKLLGKMIKFDVDFIHSGMIVEGKKICNYEETVMDFSLLNRVEYIKENIFKKQQMFFALWSKLFKAELIREAYMCLPDEQSYGEDFLCLCEYICKCSKFYMYKDAFYHYRIREESLSHQSWLDICVEESKLHSYVIRVLKENDLIDECRESARSYYRNRIILTVATDKSSGIKVLRYRYKNLDSLKGKKIALYGAGKVGQDFYCQITQSEVCEIVAWADKEKYGVLNLIPICKPEELRDKRYDIIILAVNSKEIADEIKLDLLQKGICNENSLVIWEKPECL